VRWQRVNDFCHFGVVLAHEVLALALSNLRDAAGARAACETILKDFKDSDVATLAQQCVDRLKRP